MSRIRPASLVAAAILCTAPAALAQVPNFTIADGSAALTMNGLVGQRLGGGGGNGDLQTSTGVVPVDHLFQNWFWYRTAPDSREYALSNQIAGVGGASGNRARMVFSEPINDGQIPDALRVELEYTLSDRTGPANRPETVLLTIAFKIQNMTDQSLPVNLYNYNDFDLAGNPGNDSAAVGGSDAQIQSITDPAGSQFARTNAIYTVSSTAHSAFSIDGFPTIRNVLTDAAPQTLNNAAAAFGPGDYTGANQWAAILAPAGAPNDSLVGSVTIEIRTNSCEADYNGDNQVNSADISAFLTSWINALNGACP